MSKRKPADLSQINDTLTGVVNRDVFQNLMARTGFGSVNMMEGTQYPLTRLTKNYNLLNSLYRNNWIARRVVDVVSKDMMKSWIQYDSEITPPQIDKLSKEDRTTGLRRSLLHGLNWGRLYGGAAGLMLIDGQEDQLDSPLDLDSVMPGDFKGLLVVDRWSGVYPQLTLIDDICDPEFGLPEYYQFQDWAKRERYKVHHTRIIRFVGGELPEWERQAETYWGLSCLEPCFEEIKKRDNTSANIAGLIFLSNLKVLKMNDLGQVMAAKNTKSQSDLYKTLSMQNWLMNNFSTYIMDKDDDFQVFNASFANLHDIYECFMMDLCGATQIPMTKLFGRAPGGLSSTGEGDMRNYNVMIQQEQEAILRPILEKILPVHCMSTLGEVPDDIDFHFNPVYQPSEDELGTSMRWRTEAIYNGYDRGLYSQQVALQELKQCGETANIFSNITEEIIDDADVEAHDPFDLLEGDDNELGGGNNISKGKKLLGSKPPPKPKVPAMEERPKIKTSNIIKGTPDPKKKVPPKKYVPEYKKEGRIVPGHWAGGDPKDKD